MLDKTFKVSSVIFQQKQSVKGYARALDQR